jgi:hypothetical protein
VPWGADRQIAYLAMREEAFEMAERVGCEVVP